MKATKESVVLETPVYFIDERQVCYFDTQTKCRFFEVQDSWCRLHREEIYTDIDGRKRSTEDCLLTELYKEKKDQEQA